MSRRLQRTIDDPSEVSATRSAIRRWLRRWHPVGWADEVLLACGEAIDNAIEHGRFPVDLELETRGSMLTVVIHDRGGWRVSANGPNRGLGMPIMSAMMDYLTVETTDGTTITLSRRFTDHRTPAAEGAPVDISGGTDDR